MTLCSSRAPFQHAALPCEAPRGATQRVEGARLPGGPRWQEGIHQTWENLGKILENVGKPWKPQFCVPAPLWGLCFSPPARWGSRYCIIRVTSSLRPSPPSSLPTANSRSQWALPDLNCRPCPAGTASSVGAAGPQLRAPDLSGHCRTSTARSRAQCTAGAGAYPTLLRHLTKCAWIWGQALAGICSSLAGICSSLAEHKKRMVVTWVMVYHWQLMLVNGSFFFHAVWSWCIFSWWYGRCQLHASCWARWRVRWNRCCLSGVVKWYWW